jgi:hypothetical protein
MTTNIINKTRLADLHKTMSGYVERGDIPGIVTLISCGDGGRNHDLGRRRQTSARRFR